MSRVEGKSHDLKKVLSSFLDKNGGSKMKEVVVGDGDNRHDATKGRVKRKLPETAYPQKVAPVKKPLLQEHSSAEKNASDINEEVTSSRTLRQPHTSPNYVCSRNQSFLAGRRKPLRWTVEEETTLKEGVLKFSTKNEKVPWKRILEFGSRVFDKIRTPIDLKDKWRNITAKEGL